MDSGMDYYRQQLDQHNNPQLANGGPAIQAIANSLQKQIQDAEAQGASAETIRDPKDSMSAVITPPGPSVISIFQGTLIMFTFLGMIIGAMMGFDVISGELDTGSIKSLVSCPISRDAIINGKALGAVATLALALGVTFLLSIALVVYLGAIPGLNDLMFIFAYYGSVLLYCMLFFGIAVMISIFTRSTSMSTISTVCVLVVSILLPLILVPFIGPTSHPVMENVMNYSTGQVNMTAWFDTQSHQYSLGELMSADAQMLNIVAAVIPPRTISGACWGLAGAE
jgi:ABC-2 type transport system permease protein